MADYCHEKPSGPLFLRPHGARHTHLLTLASGHGLLDASYRTAEKVSSTVERCAKQRRSPTKDDLATDTRLYGRWRGHQDDTTDYFVLPGSHQALGRLTARSSTLPIEWH